VSHDNLNRICGAATGTDAEYRRLAGTFVTDWAAWHTACVWHSAVWDDGYMYSLVHEGKGNPSRDRAAATEHHDAIK
jgi:hypothetical protein